MDFFKKALVVTALTLIVFSGYPTQAAAISRQQLNVEILNDFVLEPTKNEVILEPGETGVRNISVVNRTERTITFTIDIEDIVGSDNPNDQVKLLGEERGPYSLKDFLIPEVREFTIKTGERITIPVTVSLPADAEPRGYYGAVIISAKDQETEGSVDEGASGVTKLVTRLGSLFLVRINGEVKEASTLEVFKPLGQSLGIYSKHPEGFEVAVRNEGNVHLVHFGEVTIKNMLGREVAKLPIDAFFSLPDALRYRQATWPGSFGLGRYTAEIELYKGFGDVEQSLHTQKIALWVLPWQIIVPLLLLVAILMWVISYFKKNFKLARK